ncbi:arginase family protein [Actinomadura chokoriensis]|uniref:arginase family protein n=1 Tax=Actinomadura chokoriensis TaxID=454156 RepID=UPI0031F8A029
MTDPGPAPIAAGDPLPGGDPFSPYDVGTFAGVPRANSGNRARARAAILGIPFDTGTNARRIGCRQGPEHIRRSAPPERRFLFHSDRDAIAELNVVDYGNADVVPGKVEQAFPAIERAVSAILDHGTLPVTMGGDGSVSLPQLRAVSRRFPDLAVVHVDAHTDAFDVPGAGLYTTSTTFLRAEEEGLVGRESVVHVGPRGLGIAPDGTASAVAAGRHRVIGSDEFCAHGPEAVADDVVAMLSGRPVYLCWDMDFFDPSAAPGVASPEWGGPDVRSALAFLRLLWRLDIVHVDVNTVSPPHDLHETTGNLAARVIFECLDLAASRSRR